METIWKIGLFLVFYDLFIVAYVAAMLYFFDYNSYVEMAFDLLCMVPTFIISLSLFLKLNKMKELTQGNVYEKTIMNDLKRAAFVCLVQPIFFLIYFAMIVVVEYFNAQIYDLYSRDQPIPESYFWIYETFAPFYPIVMLTSVLADTLMLLFVLKTYRASLVYLLSTIVPSKVKLSKTDLMLISVNPQSDFIKINQGHMERQNTV